MTRIKLISDIHIDYKRNDPKGVKFFEKLPKEGVDVLVFAGDLVTNGNLAQNMDMYKRMIDSYPDVVAVLGNHDYYGSNIEEVHDLMNDFQAKVSNFHWLQNTKKEIKGQVFAGTTLWFPELPYMPGFHSWIDFRHIQHLRHDFMKQHEAARQFLGTIDEKTCVITHHIPSYNLVHEDYVGDDYNCYFVGDVTSIINQKKPKYWFFGHSHMYIDKQIGETQCILNPRGYSQEWGRNGFNPDLIIDTSLDALK